MHSSPQLLGGKSLKFLSTQGHEVVLEFWSHSSESERVWLCVCLCFCSSPASRCSVVSTRPQSSHQTPVTQPRCHGAQAPQQLRLPPGQNEVFAVSHVVGIQHQPVYWSPCSAPPSLLFLFIFLFFFPLSKTHLFYMAFILSNETVPNSSLKPSYFLPLQFACYIVCLQLWMWYRFIWLNMVNIMLPFSYCTNMYVWKLYFEYFFDFDEIDLKRILQKVNNL